MSIGELIPNERSAAHNGPSMVPSREYPTTESDREFTVLIVDHTRDSRHEIVRAIKDISARLVEVDNASDALRYLGEHSVDAIIAQLHIPGMGGVELCRRIKSVISFERIPILLLARRNDLSSEVPALEAGADAFLMGPLRSQAFRARVLACLRRKAMVDSLDETETVLFTLAQSVEGRDPALGLHCERLALIAATMGLRVGLPSSDILALQRGGYLHDVGKVAIPDSVLLKPGPLTPEEWTVMKTHPERGEKICSSLRSLAPVLPIIRHHHEKWDGTGYPDGLKGNEIPLLARILQFADIYDALTAERPYKKAFSSDQALEIMRSEVAKGWRDPELMEVFEQVVPPFADHETTVTSLQALAEAVDRCRKQPTVKLHFAEQEEYIPVKLVSGL